MELQKRVACACQGGGGVCRFIRVPFGWRTEFSIFISESWRFIDIGKERINVEYTDDAIVIYKFLERHTIHFRRGLKTKEQLWSRWGRS